MKEIIIAAFTITLLILLGINFINPPQANDISISKGEKIVGNENTQCSSPAMKLECGPNLHCLTVDGKNITQPNKQLGYCQYINKSS